MTDHYDYQIVHDNQRREEVYRLRDEVAHLAVALAEAREMLKYVDENMAGDDVDDVFLHRLKSFLRKDGE